MNPEVKTTEETTKQNADDGSSLQRQARGNGGRKPAERERKRVLAEWAASGKTVAEMVASTGWSEWTLYRWRQRARQGEANLGGKNPSMRPRAELVAVPAPDGTWKVQSLVAEVTSRHGVVKLAAAAPPRWASELIRELNRC